MPFERRGLTKSPVFQATYTKRICFFSAAMGYRHSSAQSDYFDSIKIYWRLLQLRVLTNLYKHIVERSLCSQNLLVDILKRQKKQTSWFAVMVFVYSPFLFPFCKQSSRRFDYWVFCVSSFPVGGALKSFSVEICGLLQIWAILLYSFVFLCIRLSVIIALENYIYLL